MAVKIAPDARRQFLNASGVPYSGAKLFYYAAGSTTKQNTYTTSAGSVANTNPIILDSAGRTPYGVWLTEGLTYKEVLAPANDTDPPTSPIFTEDNISGINDTNTTVSEWIASGLTPTYVSTTQFTVPGDNTSNLHVGRRLKFSVTAGTVYGRISVTAYTALTTVTVVMDSGALDSGLTSFEMSILSATNNAIPKLTGTQWNDIGVVNSDSTQTVTGSKTFSGANAHSGANSFSGAVTFSSTVDLSGAALQGGTPLIFEGATDNSFETSLVVTNPTADRTITIPDANVDLTKVRTATTALDGIVELATDAETQTGSDTSRVAPVSSLKFHPSSAKAWVCFLGTGTVTISDSYGVSSVTDNGIGNYTINFSTAFANSAYAPVGMATDDSSSGSVVLTRHSGDAYTVSAFQVRTCAAASDAAVDSPVVTMAFFGDI